MTWLRNWIVLALILDSELAPVEVGRLLDAGY
jgi:hypothetical protein